MPSASQACPAPKALLLVLLVPLKVALFCYLLTRFHMRARSSLLAALSLANYSEFGLIVGALAVANGWLAGEWLVIIAIALALSFVIASPVNVRAHDLYARFHGRLRRLETPTRHPDEQPISPGAAWILIFGMGRIGTGAYDYLHERFGERVLGIDNDADKVAAHRQAGRNVILGDATDSDFWERADSSARQIRLVMLAMPEHRANRYAAQQIATRGYTGRVAALAFFPDQAAALETLGVHSAYNAFAEAGAGFAAHVCREFGTAIAAE